MCQIFRGLLGLLLFLGSTSFAQAIYPGKKITDLEGLPSNTVSALARDSRGMIWIGTYSGLASYNGQEIISHVPESKSGVPKNLKIEQLIVDQADNIWLSCTQGLVQYNSSAKKFSPVLEAPAPGTQSGGYFHLLKGNGYLFYFHQKQLYRINTVSLKIDKENQFSSDWRIGLINVGDSLFAYSKTINSKIREILLPARAKIIPYHAWLSRGVLQMKKLENQPGPGNKYILHVNFSDSLLTYSEKDSTFSFLSIIPGEIDDVKFLAPAPDGSVFIGSNMGLFRLDMSTKKFSRVSISHVARTNPVELHAYSFDFDQSGNLFVGHAFSGITFLRLNANKFESPILYPDQSNMPFFMRKDGELLYVSRQGKGIEVYDATDNPVRLINPTTLNSWDVLSIEKISNDGFLISRSYQSPQAWHYRPITNKLTPVEINGDVKHDKLLRCDFSAIARGEAYTLFSYQGSIFKMGTSNKAIKLKAATTNCITNIIHLRDDTFVVATSDQIFSLTVSGDSIMPLAKFPDREILSSLMTSGGNIALGTRSGLLIVSSLGQLISKIEKETGLADDVIYAVAEEGGKLWLSTNRGLSSWDMATNTILNYSVGDGLQGNEFNRQAYCKSGDGFLYFAGTNGITRFKPESITPNPYTPETVISKFLINDIEIDSLAGTTKSITLPYWQNTLSFELASLEFTDNEKNSYAVFLEGVDKDWIYQNNRRFIRYPSLSPGQYRLHYKSSNNDGVFGDEKALSISILPPWYQTQTAIVFWIFLILGTLVLMVFSIIKARERKQKMKIEELERLEAERLRISKDLHDNVGSQVSFISSKLSWIENNLELEPNANRELKLIKDSASDVMTNLRETIWTLNSPSILNTALADKLKVYAKQNLTCKLEITDDLNQECVLPSEVVLNFYRVVQELINNINKHSQAVLTTIHFFSSVEINFKMVITDDGVGMPPGVDSHEGHYGLRNIKARVESVGGQINYSSEEGKGMRVDLSWKA